MRSDWGALGAVRLRDAIREVGRRMLGHVWLYRLRENPILIFATRRSGSTLLREMIYSQPGIDYIDQPLDMWLIHPHFRRLFQPSLSKFISLNEHNKEILSTYFQNLFAGCIRIRNQWNPLNPNFSFVVNRLVVKLLNAHALIDWFEEEFNADIIFLIRHPIPTSLSIIRQGWGCTAKAFLENEWFRAIYLNKNTEKFARTILKKGKPLQRYVLEWCLENLHPLRISRKHRWLTLTYEELVLRPKEVSELICSRFKLPDPERMYRTIFSPSPTTTLSSRRVILRKGPSALIKMWIRKITHSDIVAVDPVLKMFDIKAYTASSPYPHPELCHFGKIV